MSLDTVFVVCAVIGGVLFVVQLVLQLFGFAGDGVDLDADGVVGDFHPSTDFSFKVLSTQGFTAFFLMFGLIGLAVFRSQGNPTYLHGAIATLAGLAGGTATMFVVAKLFGLASRLQSSGTINLQRAINATGTVYLTIRTENPGKVTITVAGRLLTLDARLAPGGEHELPTGTPVTVTRVFEDESVEVRRSLPA